MSALVLLAALSASAVPSGKLLAEQDACFTLTMSRDGHSQDMGRVRQTVVRGQQDGRDLVFVLVHQRGEKFDMRDTFVLDGKSLRPIHFENSRNGKAHVVLDYSSDRVTGEKFDQDGASTPIDVALTTPVWEGNLFGVLFSALPLAPGGQFRLPNYQYDKGLGEFTVRVTGSQSVVTPGGPVDAWVLDAGVDAKLRVDYLIAKDSPRELGYRGAGFSQALGGDCSAIPPLVVANHDATPTDQ